MNPSQAFAESEELSADIINDGEEAEVAGENPLDGLSDPQEERLSFRVSAGLKRVLGRELITNDEVAIFELVKNSFDADAREVFVEFGTQTITIADDGTGMSKDDLRDKWLFVAYSSKRNSTRGDDYRDQVADRQHYAGSKGIGRFATDRLGRMLFLQTKAKAEEGGPVHCLEVDWAKFEEDDQRQFGRIGVRYWQSDRFHLPDGIPDRNHGTVIQVKGTSKSWSREELVRFRAGLSKLINPFGMSVDGFGIIIIAEKEKREDEIQRAKAIAAGDIEATSARIVNGKVGNFIFSTLQEKTTFIDVRLDAKEDKIETSLTDRGELIYQIKEPNPYPLLRESGFHCSLYYLNTAAKQTFTRRMGIPSTQFGNVFMFRNEFRVFPIGEDGDDWFGLDRRKAQGYARFLGTREVIGRVDITDEHDIFQEASSRNEGLITSPATSELRRCFRDHCLRRLERYVVPVSWSAKNQDQIDTLAYIESELGRSRVAAALADLVGSEKVEMLRYSTRIVGILNERSSQFESSLSNLRVIAESTKDAHLASQIEDAERRFKELKRAEAEARRIADEERAAKQEAEAREAAAHLETERARQETTEVKQQLTEEKKRNLFLTSVSSLDFESILDMHHLITIYAADLQQQIENMALEIRGEATVDREEVINRLEPISLLNKKVLAVAKFATKANFRIDSEFIEEDLTDYVVSYIERVAQNFLSGRILVEVTTDGKEFIRRFKPIEVAVVVDNLISNARKARAQRIRFKLHQPRKGLLEIEVSDDGQGVKPQLIEEGRIFEKGFTTTDGSGLGLYHVRQVLGEMKGTINAIQHEGRGAIFQIRVSA